MIYTETILYILYINKWQITLILFLEMTYCACVKKFVNSEDKEIQACMNYFNVCIYSFT